ncbi:MAG: hypothetical protein JXA33_17465 [Anaerolineae bacterium]|nr:hypothetical protein [Anaerolineae bacterium]
MTHNIAASVHQRLLNQARAQGRPFDELLQYFALERFLYRLERSPYAAKCELFSDQTYAARQTRQMKRC